MTRYEDIAATHVCPTPTLMSYNGHMQTMGAAYDKQTVFTCPYCGTHYTVHAQTISGPGHTGTARWWGPVRPWHRRARRQIAAGVSVPPQAPPLTHAQLAELFGEEFAEHSTIDADGVIRDADTDAPRFF